MRDYRYICDNIENVENYEKAAADNFKGWICHHRLETHNSDGERRPVDLLSEELMALDIYYHRPSEELIFLTKGEHTSLHNKAKKGKQASEETRRKMSEANEGENNPMYGKHHSEEAKRKNAEAHKGKCHSEETKRKLAESHKGIKHTENAKRKMAEARKGMHWYNNGVIQMQAYECPSGFVPGMLKKLNKIK